MPQITQSPITQSPIAPVWDRWWPEVAIAVGTIAMGYEAMSFYVLRMYVAEGVLLVATQLPLSLSAFLLRLLAAFHVPGFVDSHEQFEYHWNHTDSLVLIGAGVLILLGVFGRSLRPSGLNSPNR